MTRAKIVTPDDRGRITIGSKNADKWYRVEEAEHGTILLIPVEWKDADDSPA